VRVDVGSQHQNGARKAHCDEYTKVDASPHGIASPPAMGRGLGEAKGPSAC